MGTLFKAGVHAEEDALNKLKPNKNNNPIRINILVIRISKTNVLQTSKPCANCIEKLKKIPGKKGYKLDNIYYSESPEKIIKTTISILDSEEKHYSRFFKNKLHIKPRK